MYLYVKCQLCALTYSHLNLTATVENPIIHGETASGSPQVPALWIWSTAITSFVERRHLNTLTGSMFTLAHKIHSPVFQQHHLGFAW